MMTMTTSYFGRLHRIPPGMRPVAISRGRPEWYKGRVEERLAPTWAMLRMPREQYDRAFRAHLATLDAAEIADSLGPDVVLLCWEGPHFWCHRRLVAEWFEHELGITVTELGFDRHECPEYTSLPEAPKRDKPKGATPRGPLQGRLF